MKTLVPGLLLLSVLSLFVLSSCAPVPEQRSSPLPVKDYAGMTDAELIVYEQDLSDRLVNSNHQERGGVNLGIGLGSWGSGGGFGLSADKWLGGTGDNAEQRELIARRDAVRHEMKRRGLLTE